MTPHAPALQYNADRVAVAIEVRNQAYKRGLAAWLRDMGISVAEPADLQRWLENADGPSIVFDYASVNLEDLTEYRAISPELTAVALLDSNDCVEIANALLGGCSSAMAWDSDPQLIGHAVISAANGLSAVPGDVARELATARTLTRREVPDEIGDEELRYLTWLSEGYTVAKIAELSRYAERSMFRILSRLYARMGAGGRVEAVVLASRWGLLSDRSSGFY